MGQVRVWQRHHPKLEEEEEKLVGRLSGNAPTKEIRKSYVSVCSRRNGRIRSEG